MVYVTWPTFIILGPLHIFGTDKATDFKFGVPIERQACNKKKCKTRSKGRGLRDVTYFYNLGTSSISGMGIAGDFKFSARMDRQASKPKNTKVGH